MQGIKAKAIGNLGAAPEWKNFDSGNSILQFNVACTERFKKRNGDKGEHTEWVTVVLGDKLGKAVEGFLQKGTKVHVYGTLKSRAYINKQGEAKSALEIRADEFLILSERNGSGGGGASRDYGGSSTAPVADSFGDEDPDDLPF